MGLTEKDFCVVEEEASVVFPLKTQGEIYTTGWDCATRYAVDSENQCWMNSAHGDSLNKVSLSRLLNEFENEYERREFAKLMGIGMVECVCPHCNGTGKSKRIDAKY